MSETTRCTWTEDADGGLWATTCGGAYAFETGDPAENRYRYCPGCGRALEAVPYAEDDDDAEPARPTQSEGGP
jgi:hypothetical protein